MRAFVWLAICACQAGALDLASCPLDRCGAPSAPTSCPLVPSAGASVSGGTAEKLFFRNDGRKHAVLLRVDEAGSEHEHGIVAPGERLTVETAQGVVWRARSLASSKDNQGSGRLLLEHKVRPVAIDGCACPPLKAPSCNRTPWRGYRSSSDPVVFENNSPLAVSLSWFDADCEEALGAMGRVFVLPPLSAARFLSTYGHTFRAHALDDPSLLLLEHSVGDVAIPGCEPDETSVAAAAAASAEAEAEAEAEAIASKAHAQAVRSSRAAASALRLQLEQALLSVTSVTLAQLRAAQGSNATAASGPAGLVEASAINAALNGQFARGSTRGLQLLLSGSGQQAVSGPVEW